MVRWKLFAVGACGAASMMFSSGAAFAQTGDLEQIDRYTREIFGPGLAQVNSVSELSDVDPNSWAFQALKSVVERYGCLEGYPDRTYLGNRPLSRYEFAAGLNACLDKVNELIAASSGDKVTKEDLANLQRLQEEFRNELAALRGRVDALEAKTRDIESKLFSANAKLDGSVVMAVTGGGGGGSNTVLTPSAATGPFGDSAFSQFLGPLRAIPAASANVSFVARTTLNLRASITGKDELLIRLRGVTGQDLGAVFPNQASNFGTLFYALGPGNFAYDASTPNGRVDGAAPVSIDKVRYLYNFSEGFRAFIGPRVDIYEFIDTNSFSNEETDFSSGFTINNPMVTFYFTGPGGGFDWDITGNLAWRAIYFATTGGSAIAGPFGSTGLFGGTNVIATEFEFSPSKTAFIKLQYVRLTELGTLFATGLGELANGSNSDILGVSAEWAIVPQVVLFGRFGQLWSNLNGRPAESTFNTVTGTTYQVGLGFPNLLAAGNAAGAIFGQPIRFTGGQYNGLDFATAGIENVIEVYYRLQLSDRFSITPDLQFVIQPANTRDSNGLTIGTLRATFQF
ncbi:iron uptake porin [Gloeobacter morelensis]|uniref:Carbohydrate porin n=1 Tax=Gloeobacter morelensis MG652769 TaxID=2781736 RepID=A0ABY3PNY4_9CYAN|nr:iron uptake porin [Gloeobacter morelensis]UFP95396.1 carbohydrate porin [Gloeobacter morelensis MG652769]